MTPPLDGGLDPDRSCPRRTTDGRNDSTALKRQTLLYRHADAKTTHTVLAKDSTPLAKDAPYQMKRYNVSGRRIFYDALKIEFAYEGTAPSCSWHDCLNLLSCFNYEWGRHNIRLLEVNVYMRGAAA